MEKAYLKTPLGIAVITGDGNGVSSVTVFDDEIAFSPLVPQQLKQAVSQLTEYFEGQRTDFDFPLNPSGTAFQQKVWNALLQIPFGKTLSYIDLSHQLGDPKAIRAVAAANGKNPLWIIIPCHRVIGKDGSMTGYAGGIWRKKWLLEHENPVKQVSLFF